MKSQIKLITSIALCLFAGSSLAESVFVQAKQAKLMSEPSLKSNVISRVAQGTELEQLEQQGRWLRVRNEDQQAWVYQLLVATQPPMKKVSVLQNQNTNLADSARKRASSSTAVAAARGLRSDERGRESGQSMANFSALEKVEQQSVSDQDLEGFMDQSDQ